MIKVSKGLKLYIDICVFTKIVQYNKYLLPYINIL